MLNPSESLLICWQNFLETHMILRFINILHKMFLFRKRSSQTPKACANCLWILLRWEIFTITISIFILNTWHNLGCPGLGVSVRGPGLHDVDQVADVPHYHHLCDTSLVCQIFKNIITKIDLVIKSWNRIFRIYFSVILLLIYVSSLFLYIYKVNVNNLFNTLFDSLNNDHTE